MKNFLWRKRFGLALLLVFVLAIAGFATQVGNTHTFHSAATSGNGASMDVTRMSLVMVKVVGSAGADRDIAFGVSDSTQSTGSSIDCKKLDDSTLVSSVTASGTTQIRVQCQVSGAKRLWAVVSGGTTGTVTVTGDGFDNVSMIPPPGSGVTGDITQVWTCGSGNCNALTAAGGDTLNAGGADSTIPAKAGTSVPATCAAGELYFKTDATAGQNLYGCTAGNTQTLVSGRNAAGEIVRLTRESTEQSIPDATTTAISFDTEKRDDNSYWAIGDPTNIFLPATDVYQVSYSVVWTEDFPAGYRSQNIEVNGSVWEACGTKYLADGIMGLNGSCSIYGSTGHAVVLKVLQDSGGNRNITSSITVSRWK